MRPGRKMPRRCAGHPPPMRRASRSIKERQRKHGRARTAPPQTGARSHGAPETRRSSRLHPRDITGARRRRAGKARGCSRLQPRPTRGAAAPAAPPQRGAAAPAAPPRNATASRDTGDTTADQQQAMDISAPNGAKAPSGAASSIVVPSSLDAAPARGTPWGGARSLVRRGSRSSSALPAFRCVAAPA